MTELIAMAILALAAQTGDAETSDREPLCGTCHTTGRVAHEHPEPDPELEDDAVVFCSVYMEKDPDALALDWIPCPSCSSPTKHAQAKREWDALIAERKAWLEKRREVDQLVGAELMHIRTKHFELTFAIPRIKIKRRVIRQHEAMHIYAKRLEQLYQDILDVMGTPETVMLPTVFQVYMFESQRHAQTAAPRLAKNPLQSGQKVNLIGPVDSVVVSWDDPEKIRGNDEYRHQFLVHAVSHNIWHSVRDYEYWLFKRYGWVYEGLAYFLEIRQFGTPLVSCGQEQVTEHDWQGKCWESNVKKAVLQGKQPSVVDVMAKSAGQLTAMERQFAWSYIDYLMWENPNQMDDLLYLMKKQQLPTRDALRQAYGLTMGQFIDNWTRFVRTEYASKPYKGPKVREPKVKPGASE